jgi:hypothetical protein
MIIHNTMQRYHNSLQLTGNIPCCRPTHFTLLSSYLLHPAVLCRLPVVLLPVCSASCQLLSVPVPPLLSRSLQHLQQQPMVAVVVAPAS